MRRETRRTLPGCDGRSGAKRINACDHKDFRETEVQRFHAHDCRARGAYTNFGSFPLAPGGSIRANWQTRAPDRRRRSFRRTDARRYANGFALAVVTAVSAAIAGACAQWRCSHRPVAGSISTTRYTVEDGPQGPWLQFILVALRSNLRATK